MSEPFLTTKEIAAAFKKSTRWAYSMRRMGLAMPGGVTTVTEVQRFLSRTPHPTGSEKRVHWSGCKKLQRVANHAG